MLNSISQIKFQRKKLKTVESIPVDCPKKRRYTQPHHIQKILESLSVPNQKARNKPKELSQPLKSSEALQRFQTFLTNYERKEILTYPLVYFVGIDSKKLSPDLISENGHIAYRYEVLKKIGEGRFSHVWAAIDHKTSLRVTFKVLKNTEEIRRHTIREVEILEVLARTYRSHNKSVEIIENFVFRGQRFLVYPTFNSTLSDKKPLKIEETVKIASELLEAISQFHRRGIVHCDLKPQNIMFTEENTLKVIGFSSARSARNNVSFHIQSMFYTAPEVILGNPYDTAIDMWSFGCILAEMVTGKRLFTGKNNVEQLFSIMEYKGYPPSHMIPSSKKKDELSKHLHKNIEDNDNFHRMFESKRLSDVVRNEQICLLLEACLEWDPRKRITAAQALNLPLFHREFRDGKRRATEKIICHRSYYREFY